MKLTRLVFACTLLLLASVPAFALPQCADCVNNECTPGPWSIEPCRYDSMGNCENYFQNCSRFTAAPVLAEWTVVSIEVDRPEPEPKAVRTPAVAADDVCPAEVTAQ